MKETQKKALLLVMVVVCLALAGYATYKSLTKNRHLYLEEYKDQTILLKCANPNCNHVFETNRKKYYEYISEHVDRSTNTAYGLCPKCNQQTALEAIRCEKCGEVFFYGTVTGTYRDTCPKCGFSKTKAQRDGMGQ